MGRFIQRLLDAHEPQFNYGMSALEQSTARSGVDLRLIADITQLAHSIMRRLGLDPKDTTARELYLTLIASVRSGRANELLLQSDYVMLVVDGEVFSFNLIDIIESAHHELPLERRSLAHGRRSLRGEIVSRYLEHARTDERVTMQLAEAAGLLKESDSWYNEYQYKPSKTDTKEQKVQPYILTIGDIVTDAFIKLREDQAEVYTDENGVKRLSMEFGNKPPYEEVEIVQAVGNSSNAAVALTRLGLRAGLMAYLGDDEPGRESLEYLRSQGVDTQTVSVQKGHKSNYHYVLRYGADRTILIKYEDYDYAWQEPSQVPDWIYLSMLSASSWNLHLEVLEYLQAHPEVKLVFQPGTFHFEWGSEKLADIYRRSYMVVMNREEAALVTGRSPESIKELAEALHQMGPELAVITDGPDGAYASQGGRLLKMPNYPDPVPPYDRTGAGDAFASTLVAALALGEPLETALCWAPVNSMSVVQKLGAQAGLVTREQLEKYLAEAPDYYHPEEV